MRPDSLLDFGRYINHLLTYLLTIAIYRLSRYFFTIFIVDEILTIAHPYLKLFTDEANLYLKLSIYTSELVKNRHHKIGVGSRGAIAQCPLKYALTLSWLEKYGRPN